MFRIISLATVCCIALVGCTFEQPVPTLHPLSGTVTQAGKPVKGGGLLFQTGSMGQRHVINATVEADGSFVARTERRKGNGGLEFLPGAATGEYKATYVPPNNGAVTGLEIEIPTPIVVEAGKTNTVSLAIPEKLPKGQGIPRDDDPNSSRFPGNGTNKPKE